MLLIALTGGIASGKSLVSQRLSELGAVLVDADVLAREVVEPGAPALNTIADAFGPDILRADGSLDRAALGAIVFGDPASLAKLNSITHPAIWARAKELFDAAEAADPNAIVVYDVPLLVEASGKRPLRFDRVVIIEAPVDTRVDRMVEQRGMTREEALARIQSQATDEQRRAAADDVIDNSGTREETLRQVDELWASITDSAGSASPE